MAKLKAPTSIGGVDIDPTGAASGEALVFDGTQFAPGPGGGGGGSGLPIGSMTMYPGATAPIGWLFCDGATFDGGVYPELATVLGGTTLPDMRGRVPIGVGALSPDTYALGAVGGEARHQLSGGEVGAHSHTMPHTHDVNPPNTATTGADVTHTHTMTDHTHTMAHTHLFGGGFISDVSATGSASRLRDTGSTATAASSAANTGNPTNPQTGGHSANHTHDLNIGQFESLGSNTASTAATAAAAAHENRQPYRAVNFIIKAVA